ncbi:MAG: hypothetical protein V4548_13545 [Bacteroidota bacterium]
MKLRFDIQDIIETEIFYGFYNIYILGCHHIETNSDFHIQIVNIETNQNIELTEKYIKGRDYKFNRKAIKFYSFQNAHYGKFRISVHNFEDIIIKDSILEFFSFPFSITHSVLSFILGRSRKKKDLKSIEIVIE